MQMQKLNKTLKAKNEWNGKRLKFLASSIEKKQKNDVKMVDRQLANN